MSFAENLSKLMQRDGMTKYRLSKMAGCSATTVANWLAGKEATPAYLQKLSEIFSVSTDHLLTGEGKEKAPAPEGERQVSHDEIKAAFFEGAADLSKEEMDLMWNDAKDYIQYKLEQRRRKRND